MTTDGGPQCGNHLLFTADQAERIAVMLVDDERQRIEIMRALHRGQHFVPAARHHQQPAIPLVRAGIIRIQPHRREEGLFGAGLIAIEEETRIAE